MALSESHNKDICEWEVILLIEIIVIAFLVDDNDKMNFDAHP